MKKFVFHLHISLPHQIQLQLYSVWACPLMPCPLGPIRLRLGKPHVPAVILFSSKGNFPILALRTLHFHHQNHVHPLPLPSSSFFRFSPQILPFPVPIQFPYKFFYGNYLNMFRHVSLASFGFPVVISRVTALSHCFHFTITSSAPSSGFLFIFFPTRKSRRRRFKSISKD